MIKNNVSFSQEEMMQGPDMSTAARLSILGGIMLIAGGATSAPGQVSQFPLANDNIRLPSMTLTKLRVIDGSKHEISIGEMVPNTGTPRYWIERQIFDGATHVGHLQETDTNRCPAGRQVIASLQQFGNIRLTAEAKDRSGSIFSGVGKITYELTALPAPPYSNGKITLRSRGGTPLARWVDTAFSKLAPCWKPSGKAAKGAVSLTRTALHTM